MGEQQYFVKSGAKSRDKVVIYVQGTCKCTQGRRRKPKHQISSKVRQRKENKPKQEGEAQRHRKAGEVPSVADGNRDLGCDAFRCNTNM